MESKPRKIAFVSGKGGVGKTLLAANFAFCSSTVQKTLLIDLDFQNQGASGLLAEHLKNNCLNAFDLLIAVQKDQQAINIRNNLYFLPAFDPSKIDRFGSQDRAAFDAARIVDMNAIFNKLIAEGQYELVILDCHGGLDEVSFSSFICSDVTFVVTEADKVTFSGTLELLDFYINRAAALSRAPN